MKDLNSMSKQELGILLNDLQHKIDSGRFTGAQRQIRDTALEIYIQKFETQQGDTSCLKVTPKPESY